jgi:hypothetical protein
MVHAGLLTWHILEFIDVKSTFVNLDLAKDVEIPRDDELIV